MSGGYSRKGTAHVNRIHRDMDAARKRAAADRKAAADGAREQARAERARLAAMAPVDPARLLKGAWAIDRRRRGGRIVRVNQKTVTFQDRDLLTWRVDHGDVIAVGEVQS